MPPKIHKGRQCDKEYFWNVVNSLFEDEVSAILDHANRLRNGTDEGDLIKESISMTQEWNDLMQQFPWASVSILTFLIS